MSELHRDKPDATDRLERKLGRAVEVVETELNDRWPARGKTGIGSQRRDYAPLEDVSRMGRRTAYRKYPSG